MAAPGPPNVIELDQAAAIFAEFVADEELALHFPADGCFARAHLMVRRLLDRGITPSKVWAFAASAADRLWMPKPDHPGERIHWWYHVAPVLMVRGPQDDVQEMVFDPILFDRPVSVDEWRDALHDTPTVVRTALGQPPLPANGGSGYWPGPDPIEGADANAIETLEEYRQENA